MSKNSNYVYKKQYVNNQLIKYKYFYYDNFAF